MGKPGVQPAPKATNTSPGPDQAWDPGPLEGREAPSFKWHRLGPALKAGNRPGDSPSLTDQGRAFWGDPRSAQRQSGDKGTRGKQSHQGLEGDEGGWALSAGGRQGPGPRQTQAEAGAASPAAGTGAGSALCWGSGEAVATVRPRTRSGRGAHQVGSALHPGPSRHRRGGLGGERGGREVGKLRRRCWAPRTKSGEVAEAEERPGPPPSPSWLPHDTCSRALRTLTDGQPGPHWVTCPLRQGRFLSPLPTPPPRHWIHGKCGWSEPLGTTAPAAWLGQWGD